MTTKKKTKKPATYPKATAAQHYQAKANGIRMYLFQLNEALEDHAEKQAANPENWGYPGDLGRVCKQLADIVATMNGTGA